MHTLEKGNPLDFKTTYVKSIEKVCINAHGDAGIVGYSYA